MAKRIILFHKKGENRFLESSGYHPMTRILEHNHDRGFKPEIEIELEFNQSEERKPISSLVNFALIGENPIQSQSVVL